MACTLRRARWHGLHPAAGQGMQALEPLEKLSCGVAAPALSVRRLNRCGVRGVGRANGNTVL
eukprot:35655-Chlamydomonas_euryale.AAC.1